MAQNQPRQGVEWVCGVGGEDTHAHIQSVRCVLCLGAWHGD